LGQKINPIGFRLGVIKTWDSKWYSEADYAKLLHEDLKLRDFLKKRLYHSGVSKIEIERAANKAKINIYTARPGLIIGKKGSEVETLKKDLAKLTDKEIYLNIQEVRKPELDAQLVAENVALQLERRIAFRRAMKKSVTTALKFGAKGIRITCPDGSAAPRCRVPNGIAKGACHFTPCGPISITVLLKQRRLTVSLA
jgi:small subunit ribosomal protein S3